MSLEMSLKCRDKEVFSVSRGILCKRVEEQWSEIRRIADTSTIDELKTFVRNLKDSDYFGGALHRNSFRLSKRVGLVGLGFFGPHEADSASYNITISMEDLCRKRCLSSTEFFNVKASKGQVFYVHFANPVVLEPNTFYSLGFQLDGPRTGICDPEKVKDRWVGYVGVGDRVEIHFLRGSLQMPELKCILL